MAFRERIEVVVDFITGGQTTGGLNKLKADVAAADGAFAKMKVGAKGAFDMIGIAGPQVAMAAGTAFLAFGAKSVKAFEDGALAAGKFSDATGMTTEDASRLLEVTKSLGIDAGTLEVAVRRVNMAAQSGALAEYGVQIRQTADGAYDANATFLATVDAIGKMSSAADREAAAKKLMGKSWADLAEITTMSADEMQQALADVSEEQVFDPEEVAKAREFRDAMDGLKDSVEKVQLALGEGLLPALTDAADGLATVIDAANAVDKATGGGLFDTVVDSMNPLPGLIENVGSAWDWMRGKSDDADEATTVLGVTMDGTQRSAEDLAAAIKDSADRAEYYKSRADAARGITQEVSDEAERAAENFDTLSDKWDLFMGRLDRESALEDVADAFDGVKDTAEEAWTATADGAEDADRKVRDHEQAIRDAKEEVGRYAEEVLGLPPEALTDVMALIDQGKLDEAYRKLNGLTQARVVQISANIRGVFDGGVYDSGAHANNLRATSEDGANSLMASASSVETAPAKPRVMSASALWQQALSAWGAVSSAASAEPKKTRRDKFEADFTKLRKRYEVGDLTGKEYIAALEALRKEYGFRRLSDPWMAIFRELKAVRDDLKADAKDADQESVEDAYDAAARQGAVTDARAATRAAAADASRVYMDIGRGEASQADMAQALDAWAEAIANEIYALADRKFGSRNRRWARFARAKFAEAIRANPGLASRLRVHMEKVPVFPDGTADSSGGSSGGGGSGSSGGATTTTTKKKKPASGFAASAGGGPAIHIHLTGFFTGGEQEMRRAVRPIVPALAKELDRLERGQA